MNKIAKVIGIGALGAGAGAVLLAGRVLAGRHPVGNKAVPEPARRVDLDRYLGRWYEIARYEQSFEQGCEASAADYALRPDGKIAVTNSARRPDGTTRVVEGRAVVVDRATNAKLKVSFFGPFYIGNYWVLDRGDDYDWAIVGESSGRYLWLLARKARPDPAERAALIARAGALGYDTSMLVETVQP